MEASKNLRFELRAYETTDACRLAAIMQDLATPESPRVPRDAVAAAWQARYPRHASHANRLTVRGRISKGQLYLRVAGVLHADGQDLVVDDFERLAMAAGNLSIVQGKNDVALPPSGWTQRPAAPPHLRAVQDRLEASRTAAASEATQSE